MDKPLSVAIFWGNCFIDLIQGLHRLDLVYLVTARLDLVLFCWLILVENIYTRICDKNNCRGIALLNVVC